MERTAKPSLYFSAYPLKAVKEQLISDHKPGSPYLRALLSGKGIPKKDESKSYPGLSRARWYLSFTSPKLTKTSKTTELGKKIAKLNSL